MSEQYEDRTNPWTRKALATTAAGALLVGGGFLAHKASESTQDVEPQRVGYYKVEPGDNATTIGREFADDTDSINKIADVVQEQADKNGNLQVGQEVAIPMSEVNDPQAPPLSDQPASGRE